MTWRLALGLVFAASVLTPARTQESSVAGTRVLTVTYADGLITSHVLALGPAPFLAAGLAPTTGPRPSRPELPVTWLRMSPRWTRDHFDVQVESLGRNRSLANRVDLGRVIVTTEPSGLPEIAALGVQAMTFSIAPVTAPGGGGGLGLSSVRGVDLVDEPGAPDSSWRVEIQNRSGKPVRSARVLTFRDGRPLKTLTRRGRDGNALMEPMEGYRPDLGGWMPHDFAIVTAVTWTDGTMAGDIADGVDALLLDEAERLHTNRVADAIRAVLASPTANSPVTALRSALASLPVSVSDAELHAAEARLPFADLLPDDQLRRSMDSVLNIRHQEFDREINAWLTSRAAGGPVRSDADQLWLRRTLSRYEVWADALRR